MTDFRGVEGLKVTDIRYKQAMEIHGNTNASELDNEEDIKLMIEYMKGFEPDRFDVDFELPEDVLIAKFDELDTSENTVADAYDKFAAWLSSLTETPTIPDEPEEIVRPYIPDPDLTDDEIARMNDFDQMRANDVHAKLDQEGDYELLLEYVRQREGTSFLYPSDYNEDGTVNEKGLAKEAEMIAKLEELDTEDNTIAQVLRDFLDAYEVDEPTGKATNGVLPDVSGAVNGLGKGESTQITIGDNVYLVTNKGADGNELVYEVKTNEQGTKYIEMKGDNFRIQDISGELQDDLIQMIGNNNELDLGLGDDIAHLIGNDNRALMGDGNDKVYIQGDGNFTDMWRGDDKLFNIKSDNTTGIGFTGDDEFYSKGDNVLVNGESNTPVGDGLYKDGVTTDYDIENTLKKPDWFPDVDPTDPDKEPHEVDDDTEIEFNGVRYYVYKKTFDDNASDKLVYYKDDDGRTVFESQGWGIKVIEALNDTGDKNYANTVIKGDNNLYFGSNDQDTIEIQGNNNEIHGDTSDEFGDEDYIHIASGTGNNIFGEVDTDSLKVDTEGNFFNDVVFDVENVNGEEQVEPAKPQTGWVTVTDPSEQQTAQMNQVLDAFGLPADSTIKGIKQNDNMLGMTIDGKAYISETNDDGTTKSITQKEGSATTAKVEYKYDADGNVAETTLTDYKENSKTVTKPDGSKTVTVYDDVTSKTPKVLSQTSYDADGNVIGSTTDTNVADNTVIVKGEDGSSVETTYDDVTSNNAKPQQVVEKDPEGNVTSTTTYNYDDNTTTKENADGTKVVSQYSNLERGSSALQSAEFFDAEGNLEYKETYKNGEVDMRFLQGDVMTVAEFYEAMDLNADKNITADEVIRVFTNTSNPVLKAILSNFTDGVTVNMAFKLAATTTGSADFANGNNGITDDTADINMIAENGVITSGKLDKLADDAGYASLVGGKLSNVINLDQTLNTDGEVYASSTAAAIADADENGKYTYHAYTLSLLNVNGGTSVDRDDLARWGIDDAADYGNKELFSVIRQASDLVEALDGMDGAKGGEKVANRNQFWADVLGINSSNRYTYTTSSITAQNLLDMYNSCVSGEHKNEEWAENMKTLILNSGVIVVEDNVARIATGTANTANIDSKELFKSALEILEYPNLEDITA